MHAGACGHLGMALGKGDPVKEVPSRKAECYQQPHAVICPNYVFTWRGGGVGAPRWGPPSRCEFGWGKNCLPTWGSFQEGMFRLP